jgi:hypothetical protein
MSKIQKDDSGARHKALLIVVLGIMMGDLLIIGFERFRTPLLNWLLSKPEKLFYRVGLFCFFASVLGAAPLFGFSVYLWSLEGRVIRFKRFPPPRHRVVRDTPILEGQAVSHAGEYSRS